MGNIQYPSDSNAIRSREAGIPSTAVTNELARAVNAMSRQRQGQVDEPVPARKIFWVQITARDTGGGKYAAKSYGEDVNGAASAATDLTASDFGTLATAADCQIWNFAEMDGPYHALGVGAMLPVEATGAFTAESSPRQVCRLLNVGFVSVMVKIASTATGAGKYQGEILTTPTADISDTTDLVASDIGDAPGTSCLVLNEWEVGATGGTHDLDPGAGDIVCHGRITKTNTDGTIVVSVRVAQDAACATPTPTPTPPP